jgi:hypothetical protein
MRRRLILGLGLLLVFTLTSTAAYAKFRGSDMWENLMPGGGTGGLADRYPISHYQLDYHVDNGVTGLSDPGNTFAQFTASWLFFLAALMMRVVISIFDWSFHVDLITGERGLLSVSNPAAQHYYHDIVMPFLVSGAIAFGVWIAYQATKHKHADIGGTVMRVVVMSVVAIAILQHPQETIGRAYGMVSDVGESIVTAGQGKTTVTGGHDAGRGLRPAPDLHRPDRLRHDRRRGDARPPVDRRAVHAARPRDAVPRDPVYGPRRPASACALRLRALGSHARQGARRFDLLQPPARRRDQAILFWGVFLMRKRILESVSSKAAKHYEHHESQTASFVGSATVGAAAAISGGTTELATAMRAGWSGKHGGDEEEKSEHRPDSVSPPASAGRDYSPPGTPTPAPAPETGGDTSAPAETITAPEEPVTNLMTFQDHLQSARQSAPQPDTGVQQEAPAPDFSPQDGLGDEQQPSYSPTAHTTSPPRGLSTPQSFQEDLEMASLAYEKPKPQEQDEPWERVRERDELER